MVDPPLVGAGRVETDCLIPWSIRDGEGIGMGQKDPRREDSPSGGDLYFVGLINLAVACTAVPRTRRVVPGCEGVREVTFGAVQRRVSTGEIEPTRSFPVVKFASLPRDPIVAREAGGRIPQRPVLGLEIRRVTGLAVLVAGRLVHHLEVPRFMTACAGRTQVRTHQLIATREGSVVVDGVSPGRRGIGEVTGRKKAQSHQEEPGQPEGCRNEFGLGRRRHRETHNPPISASAARDIGHMALA